MKILAIGGGSMGRRRLRDLIYLNPGEVVLLEPMRERCEEVAAAFGIRGFTDIDEAFAQQPDTVTVSTPPAYHEPYVRRALESGVSVFAELPFVLDLESLTDIAARSRDFQGVLGVSHTARYYPPFRIIRDMLGAGAIGAPLYFEYSLGNYLPDWHPYEDYRRFYAGDARLGGAGMDMLIHEINVIQWWMGNIESVSARLSKLSTLEINGPDVHDVLLSFENGARGFFHHDIIERGTTGRHIRIAGAEGTIEWHQSSATVRVFRHDKNQELGFDQAADWDSTLEASREMAQILARQKLQSGHVPSATSTQFIYDSCYLRELRHFLDAAMGKCAYSMATIAEELQTLRVFHSILASDKERCEVRIGSTKV